MGGGGWGEAGIKWAGRWGEEAGIKVGGGGWGEAKIKWMGGVGGKQVHVLSVTGEEAEVFDLCL